MLISSAFLAPDNFLGWAVGDCWFLAFAVLLALVFLRFGLPPTPEWFRRLASCPLPCVAALFALPVGLRVALLPVAPKPVPSGSDDFGYLFLADTLRHFRLANSPLALPQFFEQIFILQQPVRASMFPLGQGFLLMIGWTGVLLACGALCSAVCWMLRGWLSPHWALTGGLLAVAAFGPLCYWTNCYWGGALSGVAGCLVFGAVPRLKATQRPRDAMLLGSGFLLQALTRQYEFLLLLIAVAIWICGIRLRLVGLAALCFAPALVIIAAQNKAITGSALTLPYQLYRHQYGIPATFTYQSNPVPHKDLNQEQELDYRTEIAAHGDQPESPERYLVRLWQRVRFYRFFLFAPLYLALFRAPVKILAAIAVFAFGSNFYPYFYPHYVAATAGLFLLAALIGLQRLKPAFAAGILLACLAQFLFWYAVRASNKQTLTRYESWDYLNGPGPQGRETVARRLENEPGKQIVFVHYSPVHGASEWIHNEVDLDAARVIWVHDLGDDENQKLLLVYPGRKPWLLQPDESPPKLTSYVQQSSPFEDVR
jgi:hypothetical protein